MTALPAPSSTHTSLRRYRLQDERASLKLKRVYFFWIAPDTTSFEWFSDLLHNLEQQVHSHPSHCTHLYTPTSHTCTHTPHHLYTHTSPPVHAHLTHLYTPTSHTYLYMLTQMHCVDCHYNWLSNVIHCVITSRCVCNFQFPLPPPHR